MRWNAPSESTTWKKRFAFFPRKISGTIIWLEHFWTMHSVYEDWDCEMRQFKKNYLPEHEDVQEWILSQSPLALALQEEDDV